ncbi:MAG: tRNA (adenosine(37)-N6)-threonylcarbamoyltransferase complex dimerization subunit type 1 TsaB [Gammaproteobacteria bacterium]|nr:MAG: tRNA (adenosine(37)-N6)-threonylcarbamoyltransferase complex dimerization subunit type 1 TsaB [Gammaproteobacteria bacterium]RLA36453.1 MAG: tRNA (adenosine(37)-N6)-threonylcarbamoyltransferase complex dimerization subunit type 1 TsaB [Gammaproteobacteria bacterium]
MKLLAIDTSSNACSVAVQVESEIIAKHVVEPRAHTKILLPMITAVLNEANVTVAELDAVVLGNGPGSFIGMRIGASVAQGLAYGAGINIVPISSLAAVAAETTATHAADKVLVAQDARMHEIYLGRYQAGTDGLPIAEVSEQICKVGKLADLESNYVAAGAGWRKYPQLAEMNKQCISVLSDLDHPRAEYLLPLGAKAYQKGQVVAPEALVPAYLRMKVAEVPTSAN